METTLRPVLVTGGSSGIGRATALELARRGFSVYAGVRRDSDGEDLRRSSTGKLQPVILDITIPEHIRRVREELQHLHGSAGLYGLVNVAGVGDFGPIEAQSIERLKRVFDVNFYGPLQVTQALLPLIRQARGRIVNVGSVGAHTTIPFGFPICASKHALESFTSGLRIELARWGIDVIAVDPSSIATPAADRMVDQAKGTIAAMTEGQRDHYGDALLNMAESMHKEEMAGMPPAGVAKVIATSLLARKPRTRYPVGPKARLIVTMSGLLPDRLFDKLKLKMVGIKMGA